MFVPKREEATGVGGWRKLLDETIHDLCPSSNIMVIESRRMRWDMFKS
jgi:hypothetical protein